MFSNREFTFIRTGVICCLLTAACGRVTAQNNPDRYDQAVEHFLNAEFNRADSLFISLEDPLRLEGTYENLAELYSYRSVINRRRGRQEEARRLLDLAEETASINLAPGHIVFARIYTNRAFLYISESNIDAAMEWTKKSLDISLAHPNEFARRAESWLAVGYVHDLLGEYDDAVSAYVNGLAEAEKGLEKDYKASLLVMISLNNNLGVVNRQQGYPQRALAYYEANQHLIDERFHPEHPEAAHNFNNIGTMHFEAGDVEEAVGYFLRSATILENSFGSVHPLVASTYNNAGSAYALLNRPEFAAHFLEKALDINIALQGENHMDTAVAYANLANHGWDAGNHEEALDQVTRSIQIRKNIFGDESLQLIMPWFLRGKINRDLGRSGSVLNDMERILTLSLPHLGPTHRHTVEARILRAAALRESGRPEEALLTMQQVLGDGGYRSFGPDTPHMAGEIPFPYPQLQLEALSEKAQIFVKKYEQGLDPDDLESAFQTWLLCIDVMEELQIHFRSENSGIIFDDNNDAIFEQAIDAAYRLYNLSGDSTYINVAFTLIEQSKARVARAFLTESDARQISDVPEYYTRKEEDFRHAFNSIERELSVEMIRHSDPDGGLVRSLQDSLFQIRLQQQAYSEFLKDAYPRYHQLKYDRKVVGFETVRQQMAESGFDIVSYYAGTDHLFAVTISEKEAGFYRLSSVRELEALVSALRESIANPGNELFSETAHTLYKVLVEPLMDSLTASGIVILPDHSLNYLPFELLLTHDVSGTNYHEWPWLIRDSHISYAPSATVLQQMERAATPATNKLLAVAPFAAEIDVFRTDSPHEVIPPDLSPLPFSRYETEEVARIFTSVVPAGRSIFSGNEVTLLMNSDATVNNINSLDLERYRYIHFATHALTSDVEPALSGIRMAVDGPDKHTLFLHDIYRLDLNAELVVLSGCESGFGPLSGSEGVIGFARAFILAGASSLLTSLWKVDDRSTAELMIHFYSELMQGENKSSALRNAKLALIDNPGTSSPSRWAAFVLAGL